MKNLKFRPPGYSSPEMLTRAGQLCVSIIHELAKSNMPAVADLDSDDHYRIVLTVANEPYNVMGIHEIFERRKSTGKFKFKYHRIYVGKLHDCTCRMYEQTEVAKNHSLVKVVNVLKDRYQAIESASIADRLNKETLKSREIIVANLRRDFPRLSKYIQDSTNTEVELRFRVDDSTARMILNTLLGSGVPK